ncbi:MAG: protein disulfide isomerase family protein [Candidatus Falkowbacteria bacterium]
MKKKIILVLLLAVVAGGCSLTNPAIKKELISTEEAKAKTEKFITENLIQPGKQAMVKEIVEENGLYKMVIDIGSGTDINSYLTMDGKNFFPQAMDIAEVEKQVQESAKATESQNTTAEVVEYTNDDKEKIKVFVECLEKKNFKIYGANWCGWTKKLTIDTFGGFDIVAPIYIECTEEEALCAEEGVSGYPTIKLNGEKYEGGRTLKDIADKTGCVAPDVVTQVNTDASTGGCGG